MAKTSKEIKETLSAMKNLTSEMAKTNVSVEKVVKGIGSFDDKTDDATKRLKKMNSDLKEIVKLTKKSGEFKTRKIEEYSKKLKDLRDAEEGLSDARKQRKKGAVDQEELNSAIDKVYDLQASFDELENEIIQNEMASKKLFGSIKDTSGSLISMFASMRKGPSALSESAEKANIYAKNLKLAGLSAGKMPKLLGKVGAVAKTVGGVVGGVSKMFLGWPGLIAAALVKIVDMSLKVEQYIKDANKAFAAVRGPDIMTDDVEKQFEDFNKQIFDIGQNLAVGLHPKQIQEFMSAVAQAGVRIGRLNEGIYTYRQAIYVAAKASKTLGLELPQVGDMMSQLLNTFRMNVKEIDKTFVQVAFDAQKSGLNTDRFWGAVQNATASLSFYGVFVEAASKMLAKFSENAVMGADDTANMVEDISKSFTNMSREQAAAFLELTDRAKGGTTMVREMFQEAADKWGERAKGIKARLDIEMGKEEKDVEAIKRLQNELAASLEKQQRAEEAVNAKSAVAMAPYIGLLSDQANKLIVELIKTKTGVKSLADLKGSNIYVAENILEAAGVSKDLLMKMKSHSTAMDIEMAQLLGVAEEENDIDNDFLDKLDELRKTTESGEIVDTMNKLRENIEKGDKKAINAQTTRLAELLEVSGQYDESTAKGIAKIARLSPKMNEKIANLISSDEEFGEEQRKALKKVFDEEGMGTKEYSESADLQLEQQKAIEKKAKETFDEIRKQTLSAKEAMEITKEGAKWRGAMIYRVDKITNWVMAIGRKKNADDPMVKEANELLYSLNINAKDKNETMKNLIDHTKKIETYEKDIEELDEKIMDEQERLNEKGDDATEAEKANLQKMKDQKEKLEKGLEKSKRIVAAVNTVNDVSDRQLKMQKLMIMGDKEVRQTLFRDFAKKMEGKGLGTVEMMNAFDEYIKSRTGLTGTSAGVGLLGKDTGAQISGLMSGLKEVAEVTREGHKLSGDEFGLAGVISVGKVKGNEQGARVERIKRGGLFLGHANEMIVGPHYAESATVRETPGGRSTRFAGVNVVLNVSNNMYEEASQGKRSVERVAENVIRKWEMGYS